MWATPAHGRPVNDGQSFFDGTSRTGHCPSFANVLVCTGKSDTRVCQDRFDRSCPAPRGSGCTAMTPAGSARGRGPRPARRCCSRDVPRPATTGTSIRRRDQPAGSTDSDPYWVNPDGNAARQVAAYTKDGNDKNADQRLLRVTPRYPGPELRGYPQLRGPGGVVVVLPGASRRRRHGSSPCTHRSLRDRSVVSSAANPPRPPRATSLAGHLPLTRGMAPFRLQDASRHPSMSGTSTPRYRNRNFPRAVPTARVIGPVEADDPMTGCMTQIVIARVKRPLTGHMCDLGDSCRGGARRCTGCAYTNKAPSHSARGP